MIAHFFIAVATAALVLLLCFVWYELGIDVHFSPFKMWVKPARTWAGRFWTIVEKHITAEDLKTGEVVTIEDTTTIDL